MCWVDEFFFSVRTYDALNYARLQYFDPDSAKFDSITSYSERRPWGRATVVCGMVNAKNILGAYVGRTPVYVLYNNRGEHGVIASTGESAEQACAHVGARG
jgi:hypothetical protein